MKRLLFISLMFVSCAAHSQDIQLQNYPLATFQGLIDVVDSSKLKPEYAKDLLNVYTDTLGMIVKVPGYQKYNPAAIGTGQKIRKLYIYNTTAGSSYVIANSSWSMYANTTLGTDFTAVKGGLNSSYTDSYCTANGTLYRDNGYDGLGGKWDGTTYTDITVLNSTSMVTGKYIVWFHNRLFKAGVSDSPSVVFYSEVLKPDDFNTTALNYININKNDGDSITGLYIWGAGDKLLVTKKYSTWEIVENSAGSFVIRLVSNKIGCLYNTTMDELNNYPVWVSHRGVERFNGSGFDLLSTGIDSQIKDILALTVSANIKQYGSAEDWGAGTCVGVDTTSYNGSVALTCTPQQEYVAPSHSVGDPPIIDPSYNAWISSYSYQSFRTTETIRLSAVSAYIAIANAGSLRMEIQNASKVLVASTTLTGTGNMVNGWTSHNFNTGTYLTKEATYYLVITATNTSASATWLSQSGNDYTLGDADDPYGIGQDHAFRIYRSANRAGTWTSGVYGIGNDFLQWGVFSANYNPTASSTFTSVKWYVSVATASAICNTSNLMAVSTGYVINSSSGNYILVVASMTTTDIDASPILHDISIRWFENSNISPTNMLTGVVCRDRYYLSVSTSAASPSESNTIYCYQSNGEWTKISDWHMSAACIYRDKFHTGDSKNAGYIYQQDIEGLYSYDGNAYDSWYEFPALDFGAPSAEKWLKNIRMTTTNSGGTLYLKYKRDEWDTWHSKEASMSGNGIIRTKIPLPFSTKAYNFTFRVGNDTAGEDFRIKRLDCEYGILKPR